MLTYVLCPVEVRYFVAKYFLRKILEYHLLLRRMYCSFALCSVISYDEITYNHRNSVIAGLAKVIVTTLKSVKTHLR